MPTFQQTCDAYYSSPMVCVSPEVDVHDAYLTMRTYGISAVAVVNEVGAMVGVLSLTDLLRAGLRRPPEETTFPRTSAEKLMTTSLLTVTPEETLRNAAAKMVEQNRHRVYVVDPQSRPVGVLSCRDLMTALGESRRSEALAAFMAVPVHCVEANQLLSEATQSLAKAHVSGLVVLDEGLPVGSLTQRDVLAAGEWPQKKLVDDALNPRILCLPLSMKLHRAAALAAALKVRRVVVMDGERVAGILTGLDFARAISTHLSS